MVPCMAHPLSTSRKLQCLVSRPTTVSSRSRGKLFWIDVFVDKMKLTLPVGMHAIKERPVVVDGQIVIRPIMVVALTYDHRLLDGREAVTFLGACLLTTSACVRFADPACFCVLRPLARAPCRLCVRGCSQGAGLHRGPPQDAPRLEATPFASSPCGRVYGCRAVMQRGSQALAVRGQAPSARTFPLLCTRCSQVAVMFPTLASSLYNTVSSLSLSCKASAADVAASVCRYSDA